MSVQDPVIDHSIPMTPRAIELFNEMFILARKKDCSCSLHFSDNDWYVTLGDNIKNDITKDYTILEHALDDAVQILKAWS